MTGVQAAAALCRRAGLQFRGRRSTTCWRGDQATGLARQQARLADRCRSSVYAARGTMAASVGAGERQFFTEFAERPLRDLTERDVDLAIAQGFKANIQPR